MCSPQEAVLARADGGEHMTRNATEELRSSFEVLIREKAKSCAENEGRAYSRISKVISAKAEAVLARANNFSRRKEGSL